MATWSIPSDQIINYSPDGDDIDTFSQKVKFCIEALFEDVRALQSNGISTSLDDTNAKPYEPRVNPNDNGLYIRNGKNTDWIYLGELAKYFGVTPEKINAADSSTNTEPNVVTSNKSLVLCNGDNVLVDYDGSESVRLDLQNVLARLAFSQETGNLSRLVENLYLALDAANLNPGGYDNLFGETFYGTSNNIDTTNVKVTLSVKGDSTVEVSGVEGLIEGANYILTDGTNIANVKINQIISSNGTNRVTFTSPVNLQFRKGYTNLIRSQGTISEGEIAGNDTVYVTKTISFVNENTGEENTATRAHVVVKHENVADASIKVELALRSTPTFVKGEVIAIGEGTQQTAYLSHTSGLTSYKFALYFDGVKQTTGFSFAPDNGKVIFNAPSNTIVTADYFFDWGEENFVEMTKTGTYPDSRDPEHATSQFVYTGDANGKVATVRLTLNRGTGKATDEIVSVGKGTPQGFKLAHKAVAGSISVTPSSATWSYNESQNVVIVTAPVGNTFKISYNWRGKEFAVNSFAAVFNE